MARPLLFGHSRMMQLTINGCPQTFIPLQTFRSQWKLPDEFSLAYFEPKDWQGLGRLDGSGKALATVRQRVIEAAPQHITLVELIAQVQTLTNLFHLELMAINPQIGLREVEIEFAVAGFADVLQSVVYQLLQLSHAYGHDPSQIRQHFNFAAIYQNWLDSSVRLAATPRVYVDKGVRFEVYVVYNAYGRVGLKVEVASQVFYVTDTALACPAANYMLDLCGLVAQAFCGALTG